MEEKSLIQIPLKPIPEFWFCAKYEMDIIPMCSLSKKAQKYLIAHEPMYIKERAKLILNYCY